MAKATTAERDQKGLMEQCRLRQGHRCIISGRYHREYMPLVAKGGLMQCAHILPFSPRKFDGGNARYV